MLIWRGGKGIVALSIVAKSRPKSGTRYSDVYQEAMLKVCSSHLAIQWPEKWLL